MGSPHSANIERLMGQKDTVVETTYGKAQRETATYLMDRRPRQDCGESLDTGGIGPVTLKSIGEAYGQLWAATGWYGDDDEDYTF